MKKILTFLFTIITIAGFSQSVTVTVGDVAGSADTLIGTIAGSQVVGGISADNADSLGNKAAIEYLLKVDSNLYATVSFVKDTLGNYILSIDSLLVINFDTLYKESLNETDFATSSKWTTFGNFSVSGGKAVFSGTSGTIRQKKADLLREGVAGKTFQFTYTADSIDWIGCVAFINTDFAIANDTLVLSDGTHTTTFTSNSNPVDFKIECTCTSGDFTFDDVTLKIKSDSIVFMKNDLYAGGIFAGTSVFSGDIQIEGTLRGGSPVKVSPSLQLGEMLIYIDSIDGHLTISHCLEVDATGDTAAHICFQRGIMPAVTVDADALWSNNSGKLNYLLKNADTDIKVNYEILMVDTMGRAGIGTSTYKNVITGYQAGYANTTGIGNTFMGYRAGYGNTTGNYNTIFGKQTGYGNTTGGYNTFLGNQAGDDNTTGEHNVFLGHYAAFKNTVGNRNIAIGGTAGAYQNDGSTPLQTPQDAVYIGANAMSGSDPAGGEDDITNEIVIGFNAIGNGANSITLGNDAITTTVLKGNVLIGSDTLKIKPDSASYADMSGDIHTISYTLSLRGVSDEVVLLAGDFEENVLGLTGDYATDWTAHNNHAYFRVNSITGSDTVLFTGTSLSESTSVPTVGDTEVVIVNSVGQYQTGKKWWEITNVDIKSGISAINYDLGVLGYNDLSNTDFTIMGYRMSIYSQGLNGDIRFQLYSVHDLGSDSLRRHLLEDIGVDANNAAEQIIDSLRTGGSDRSYDPVVGTLMGDNEMFIFKQGDFNSYFSSNENKIESATKDEGFYIRLSGMPSAGITNIDHVSIEIRYKMGVD